MTPAAIAPSWRIDLDPVRAARAARAARADALALEFGGAHRGHRLDDPSRDDAFDRIRDLLPVHTLAVNHANDIGLFTPGASPQVSEPCLRVVLDAGHYALRHNIEYLHIPVFRASSVTTPAQLHSVAVFLRRCLAGIHPTIQVLIESALDVRSSLALCRATDDRVKIVADTGNLADAGIDAAGFARGCAEVGALAPVVHVKDARDAAPATSEDIGWAFSLTPSVLVENDYRAVPSRLAADIAAVHAHRRLLGESSPTPVVEEQ